MDIRTPRLSRGRTIPTVAAVAAVTVVTILVAGVGVARSFLEDAFNYHIDFDVYRAGGQAVLDGEPLYERVFPVSTIALPFTYPPLSALLFVPIALLPSWVGYIPFALVSALSLVHVTVIVLNALSTERGPAGTNRTMARRTTWTIGWLLLPLAIWMWPITQTLFYGQINILLMLMVVADLLLPRTRWPRGMLIGLAAAIKLTPAVFGLYFLVNRQWREAVVSVVSGVGFTALAWLVLPGQSWTYWTETITDPARIGGLASAANQSVRGMIARASGNPESMVGWYLAVVVIAVVVVLVMLGQIADGAHTAAVCTNALLALLVSPVSWAHHWVWVLPMVLVAWHCWSVERSRGAGLLAVLTVAVSLLPMHLFFPTHSDVEMQWSGWMQVAGSGYVVLGLLWLLWQFGNVCRLAYSRYRRNRGLGFFPRVRPVPGSAPSG